MVSGVRRKIDDILVQGDSRNQANRYSPPSMSPTTALPRAFLVLFSKLPVNDPPTSPPLQSLVRGLRCFWFFVKKEAHFIFFRPKMMKKVVPCKNLSIFLLLATHTQLKNNSITPRKPSTRGVLGRCPQAGLSPLRQDGYSLKKKLAKRRISWIKVDRCPMLHHTMRDIEPCVGGCTPSSPNGRGGDCAVARDAMNGLGRDGFSLLFAHFGAKKPIKNLYGGLLKKCLLNPPYLNARKILNNCGCL